MFGFGLEYHRLNCRLMQMKINVSVNVLNVHVEMSFWYITCLYVLHFCVYIQINKVIPVKCRKVNYSSEFQISRGYRSVLHCTSIMVLVVLFLHRLISLLQLFAPLHCNLCTSLLYVFVVQHLLLRIHASCMAAACDLVSAAQENYEIKWLYGERIV